MLTVTDRHTIRAALPDVFRCVWKAELWPEITSHVRRVQMVESGDRAQKMLMTVLANGTEHTVESVREAEPGLCIRYTQTKPPSFLEKHDGQWNFSIVAEGVCVDLVHRVVVDYGKALSALQVDTPAEADRLISSTLKDNGARTLVAIKDYLERRIADESRSA